MYVTMYMQDAMNQVQCTCVAGLPDEPGAFRPKMPADVDPKLMKCIDATGQSQN